MPSMFYCSHGAGEQNYDQIAAALLNRYPSLMMEMGAHGGAGQAIAGHARPRTKEDPPLSAPPAHGQQGAVHKPATSPPDPKDQERRPPEPVRRPPDPAAPDWGVAIAKPPARDSPRLNTPPGPEHVAEAPSKLPDSAPKQPKPPSPVTPAGHYTAPPVGAQHAPEPALRPLGHSVASQLPGEAREGLVREDMQAGLTGLWKMQAQFQEKKKAALTATPSFPSPVVTEMKGPVQTKDLNGPPALPHTLHTPRSPPHPPPPRPQLPPALEQPPAPHEPAPSFEPPRVAKPPEYQNQNCDRMEIKNSGIPGPSAITWKRKSLEDSPTSNHVKSKKRKLQIGEGGPDPYSFHDEESPARAKIGEANGSGLNKGGLVGGAPIGPVYKYKSAMLSREVEREEEKEEEREEERGEGKDEGREESDESSRSSSGGAVSPVKKKYKRPKLEEWSVAAKPAGRPAEKQEKTDGPRKGPLWGLPILPKPPQKPEKVREPPKSVTVAPPASAATSGGKVDVKNVWLNAFGAGSGNKAAPAPKPKKKPVEPPAEVVEQIPDTKKPVKVEKEEKTQKTILDIPPEVRRKSRPAFGGLVHFGPDWVRSVRRHHERCRIPPAIENSLQLSPKILAGQSTPKKSYEDFARKDMVSPPDLLAMERERIERSSVTTAALTSLLTPEPVRVGVPTTTQEEELPGQLPSIVETILANRKKLREAAKMGRMYKNPFMKEKKPKRMAQSMKAPLDCTVNSLLMPTPGLPAITEDTKDELLDAGFGDFRRYTLLNFLEPDAEGKAAPVKAKSRPRKLGDVPVLPAANLRQIFGLAAASVPQKTVKTVVKAETNGHETPPVTPKKEKKKKKEAKTATVMKAVAAGKSNKFRPVLGRRVEAGRDDGSYSQEVGVASDHDNKLQAELGGFALDLLDDNLSWAKQVTIQNLVIWEPAETPIVIAKKKKGKKKGRSRKSGLDFAGGRRKGRGGALSASGSRATSPVAGEEPHEVTHSVQNVLAESSR